MKERKYYAIKKKDELLGFLVTEIHDDLELHKPIVPVSREYVNLFQYDDELMKKIEKGELSKEEVRPVAETEYGFIVEYTSYKKLGGFWYCVILLYTPIPSYSVLKECEQIASILNKEVGSYSSKEQAGKSLESKEKNGCEQIASILNEEEEVECCPSKEQAFKSLERKEKLILIYKDKCEPKLFGEISKCVKNK
jgi:hypothetical protein